ncbi:hypothetical protein K8R03_02555 [Candidatus Kaiserbacteria bacterium]|nr:hypothetical protein [Candidatus Kaiserbacteria bacterium]
MQSALLVTTATVAIALGSVSSANAGMTCNGLTTAQCAKLAVEAYGTLGDTPTGVKPAQYVRMQDSGAPDRECTNVKMTGNADAGAARWKCTPAALERIRAKKVAGK